MDRNCRSIEELAERASAGEPSAFEELIRTQLGRLENHVNQRLGARLRGVTECDDVIQETLLKACSAIQNFIWSGEEPFFRWLARIAEHVIWKTSQKRRVQLVLEPVADSRTTPATRAARKERAARLEQSLSDLSDDHRRVITLTRIEGLPIAQVAEHMNRSPNAVKKLLARALHDLRRHYGDSTGSLRVARTLPPEGGTSHAE